MLPLVHVIVKSIGLLFLSQCSSNREVAIMMMVVGWYADYINEWSSYLNILSQSKSTNKFVANRRKVHESCYKWHHYSFTDSFTLDDGARVRSLS